ncbi:MAG: hypothetical protein RIE53_05595 [Rhodothermales bacterium]
MNATWLYGKPSALHRLAACAFALMMVLPLAIPVLGHHATIPVTDHGEHNTSRDAHQDMPPRDAPCPPLETGLEACCIVDGLPPAPASTTAVPRVDRAPSLVVISPMMARSLTPPPHSDPRCTPHPWPVPTRIVFSTFLN